MIRYYNPETGEVLSLKNLKYKLNASIAESRDEAFGWHKLVEDYAYSQGNTQNMQATSIEFDESDNRWHQRYELVSLSEQQAEPLKETGIGDDTLQSSGEISGTDN